MSTGRRWLARLGLVAGGIALALALAEGLLRATLEDLPSLAPLADLDPLARGEARQWMDPPDRYSTDCRQLVAGRGPVRGRKGRLVLADGLPEDSPARSRLWVVGDSVVQGWGVPQDQAYATLLAKRLSEDTGAAVKLTQLGANGLGACGWLFALHQALDDQRPPDAVVLQLFGDDLEQRDVVLVNGQPVAAPEAAPTPALRVLARHSYLGNRLWLSWHARYRASTPRRGARQALLHPLRIALERLETAGVPWVLALVPPAGIERCTEAEEAFSDCAWITADLAQMATWLEEDGLSVVDLRGLWATMPPDTLPEEEREWSSRRRLPVHPGPDGHEALARALWPALQAARQP